jgi:hypothetical protein
MGMESTLHGVSERSINVSHGLGRNADSLADTVIEGRAPKAPQHEIVTAEMEAFGKGWMAADAPIDPGFMSDASAAGSIDLHDKMWMVGMQKNSRVIAAAEHRPWPRQRLHLHRIMRVHASETQR